MPLVANIRFEPGWNVAISPLPSPSRLMAEISVIFTVASLARTGNCPAVISAEVVNRVVTASESFFIIQSSIIELYFE
jgi:hypothetical protein